MKCNNCKQKVNKDDLFCQNCGSQDFQGSNQNNGNIKILVAVFIIIFCITTIPAFLTEHDVDYTQDYDDIFDTGRETLTSDTELTIQNLTYIIPEGYEVFGTPKATNYSEHFYYDDEDYNSCDIAIEVDFIDDELTIEEQVKSSITSYLTDKVSETETVEINDNTWYTFEIDAEYEVKYYYFKEHSNRVYKLEIKADKDFIMECESKKGAFINSLNLN